MDVEEHYKQADDAVDKFDAPLIVIDPVDKNRNVAAALSLDQFSRFVAAAQKFVEKPNKRFFFGRSERAWSTAKLQKMLTQKELIAAGFGYPKGALGDVMWGQLKRFGNKIGRQLLLHGFRISRSDVWTDEKKEMIAVFELESLILQRAVKRIGPEVTNAKDSRRFLGAHKRLVSGPRIENGRWVIEIERKYTSAEKFLREYLKQEKRREKALMKKALNKRIRIMDEKDLARLFRQNRDFARFLSQYLRGKEEFLDY